MTGGAFGSLFAQFFHLTAAERKTLLVAGAAGRHDGDLRHAGRGRAAGRRAAALRMEAAQLHPGGGAGVVAAIAGGRCLIGPGPLFPVPARRDAARWGLLACAPSALLAGLRSGLLTAMVYGCEDAFEQAAGPLDVVAGDRRRCRRPRRLDRFRARWASATTTSPGCWPGSYDPRASLAILMVEGADLVDRARLGHLRRRAGAAADHGRRAGRARGAVLPAATPGFWALLGMAAMMGGTMRAPLTRTVFAVELTGNSLLPPLSPPRSRRSRDRAPADARS